MDMGEAMCYDECYEMCKPDDSQTCTPGENNILYVNFKKFKTFLKGNKTHSKLKLEYLFF